MRNANRIITKRKYIYIWYIYKDVYKDVVLKWRISTKIEERVIKFESKRYYEWKLSAAEWNDAKNGVSRTITRREPGSDDVEIEIIVARYSLFWILAVRQRFFF